MDDPHLRLPDLNGSGRKTPNKSAQGLAGVGVTTAVSMIENVHIQVSFPSSQHILSIGYFDLSGAC